MREENDPETVSLDNEPGPSRVIGVAGSFNLRDLGGLPVTGGGVLRRGRLFRGDYPAFAERDGGAAVRRLGLRTVVDLRRDDEAEHECVTWADHGVAHFRFPIVSGSTDLWRGSYPSFLRAQPEAVGAAAGVLMDPARHPALFHCAAGKDRTGVIAAMLLSVLDVDPAEIVADYTLTSVGLPAIIARLSGAAPYARMLSRVPLDKLQPRPEMILALLDFLGEHGGAADWLAGHGVARGLIEEFRAEMLRD
jgi:protein-tyrosine phosphatase